MALPHILIADDEPHICNIFKERLSRQSWVIESAADGQRALDLMCDEHFDIAVLDFKMPYLNGLEVLQRISQKGIRTDVFIMTGYSTVDLAVEVMKAGARDFLPKPIAMSDFIRKVHNLLNPYPLSSQGFAGQIDAYVKAHAFQEGLRLDNVCSHFSISSRYVSKLLRAHFGASFRERLTYYRMQKAKQLLVNTDELLYEIAEQCGFRNSRRFSEAFYRQEGIPPRKFRETCSDKRNKF